MTEQRKCECCEDSLRFQWSDTHGVGVCINCGLPYRIYFRDDAGKLIDKAPESPIFPEWIAVAKRYWAETKKPVFPGEFDMGFDRRTGVSFSGAKKQDATAFWDWVREHDAEMPKPADAKSA